ncbi:1,2-phenylacetyl-CoA epoxidase subunit PaaE [Microbaculum marinum]|uniref:1,2-phenylacetyl-CoA epoxidase subunit PaaE n=1 Tax=Microbaculum marinum TaxID=1764581 RepID=A0AAW9RS30_9HYPH
MRFDFHPLNVRAVDRQTTDAVAISFELPKDVNGAFKFRPGQYVTLRTRIDGEDVRRTYSICSLPGEDCIRVGVKVLEGGRFSTFANTHLKPGDVIEVMEPEGRFGVEIGGTHDYLLIAAGSGITPMLSIAAAVLSHEPHSRVTLVYGNRTSDSIMFLEELEDLKDAYLDRFTLITLLSREAQDVELLNGRIDEARLKELAARGLIDPAGADAVMICGPGEMIDTVSRTLVDLGVDEKSILAERFVPADGQAPRTPPSPAARAAATEGAHVETILDGRRLAFDITDPQMSVIDAGLAAGLDLPYSCKGGMCCTCRCKIVEGEAEMAVNYSLQPWEIEEGFTLACQSRPTTKRLVLDFDAV